MVSKSKARTFRTLCARNAPVRSLSPTGSQRLVPGGRVSCAAESPPARLLGSDRLFRAEFARSRKLFPVARFGCAQVRAQTSLLHSARNFRLVRSMSQRARRHCKQIDSELRSLVELSSFALLSKALNLSHKYRRRSLITFARATRAHSIWALSPSKTQLT